MITSESPLILSFSPRGEGTHETPSPHPHPRADAEAKSSKFAKASLPGEGWGEGAGSGLRQVLRFGGSVFGIDQAIGDHGQNHRSGEEVNARQGNGVGELRGLGVEH